MPPDYQRTGVLGPEELQGLSPTRERMKQGPVAIVECLQEIPCDACVLACTKRYITKDTIISPPILDPTECSGCAQCVAKCPGLAVFVLDMSKSPEGKAWVTIPWEFLPLPNPGDQVGALNREGRDIGPAKVIRVRRMGKGERTAMVTIEVSEDLVMEARSMRL